MRGNFHLFAIILAEILLAIKNIEANQIISLSIKSKSDLSSKAYTTPDETPENEHAIRRRLQSNIPTHAHSIYQGHGAYYVDIFVGSPPQLQTVIVDTGSQDTGIPCSECINCGGHHTADPAFIQSQSKSFHYLTCSECHKGQCNINENTCDVLTKYAENSAWEGVEIQDSLHIGAPKWNEVEEQTQIPLKFFCMQKVHGAFQNQLANGIMGLGASKYSFWKQMYNQGLIESQKFSICLDHNPFSRRIVGRLALGGVDERLGHSASMMKYMDFTDLSGYYNVQMRRVHISLQDSIVHDRVLRINENQSDGLTMKDTMTIQLGENMINRGGVIIDSGTTGTLFTPEIKAAFDVAWKTVTGENFPVEPVQISSKELQNWPTIILQMKGSSKANEYFVPDSEEIVFDPEFPEDVIVSLPPSHYMRLDLETKKYIPLVNFDGKHGEGSILGSNFLRSHNTLFDVENKRIGMIKSDCNFVTQSTESGPHDLVVVPAPYANAKDLAQWYNDYICKGQSTKCPTDITPFIVPINMVCFALLCMLIVLRPKRKNYGDSDDDLI